MRLEISPRGGEPVLLTMDGVYFAPIVKVVIFDDLLVFLGAKTWYRFEGMTSFDANLRQGKTDFRFRSPSGISETALGVFREERDSDPRREDRPDRNGDASERVGVCQLRDHGPERRRSGGRAEVRLSRSAGRGPTVLPIRDASAELRVLRNIALSTMETTTTSATAYSTILTTSSFPIQGTPNSPAISIT